MINWTITIPGNPVPKGRPRGMIRGRVFTPPRTRDYEELVGQYAALKWRGEPTKARLFVSLRFYRENERRADFDNLTKAVCDGLQGIVYVDDSQIKEAHIRVEVDRENPRVEVWVRDFRETDKLWREVYNRQEVDGRGPASADAVNMMARK